MPVIAQAVDDQQVELNFNSEDVVDPLPVLDFNQKLSQDEFDTYTSNARSRLDVIPLPLLAEEPDSMYQHHLKKLGIDESQAFPEGVYPFNFGQFLIGQLTLAEYNNIWQTVRERNLKNRLCKLHYRENTLIATGIQCISYFNYLEAHSDNKGVLSSISISGNQPPEHTTSEMLQFLDKRYRILPYSRMPDSLKEIAKLRQDLCNDLSKLMDNTYKCEEHWYYFRNFYMVFASSTYLNHRKEQFTYGTLHHFIEHEGKMVKRRLAIVRQELNVKYPDIPLEQVADEEKKQKLKYESIHEEARL